MIDKLGAIVIHGQEADDAMSIKQYESDLGSTCIVTIDKDLDNTPGWHYNFDSLALYYVQEKEATYNFYRQLLMGDRTDNIRGIPLVGEVNSKKYLEGCYNEDEMAQEVYRRYTDLAMREVEADELDDQEYLKVIDKEARRQMLENGQLLWMRRHEGEMWQIPETVKSISSD